MINLCICYGKEKLRREEDKMSGGTGTLEGEIKYSYYPMGCFFYAGLEVMKERIAKNKLTNPFSTGPNPCGESEEISLNEEGDLEKLSEGEKII